MSSGAPVGRALVFTALGIPVASCIFVASFIILMCGLVSRVWPLPREIANHAVYLGLSLGIIWIALRARRRARSSQKPEIASWLARLVPVLLALGAAVGLWMGFKFGLQDVESQLQRASRVCRGALGMTGHAADIESCIPTAISCRGERDAVEAERGRIRKDGDEWFGNPWYECVKRKLAAR